MKICEALKLLISRKMWLAGNSQSSTLCISKFSFLKKVICQKMSLMTFSFLLVRRQSWQHWLTRLRLEVASFVSFCISQLWSLRYRPIGSDIFECFKNPDFRGNNLSRCILAFAKKSLQTALWTITSHSCTNTSSLNA